MRPRRCLIRPQSLTRFLNQSRSPLRPPVLEPDPKDQEIRRLKAQRVEWANMATLARLDRDAVAAEVENQKRENDWLRSENQRLWLVVAASEALVTSRTWTGSNIAGNSNGPVGRFKGALVACRAASRDRPMVYKLLDGPESGVQ